MIENNVTINDSGIHSNVSGADTTAVFDFTNVRSTDSVPGLWEACVNREKIYIKNLKIGNTYARISGFASIVDTLSGNVTVLSIFNNAEDSHADFGNLNLQVYEDGTVTFDFKIRTLKIVHDTLWEGTLTATMSPVELSFDITEYDKIVIRYGSTYRQDTLVIPSYCLSNAVFYGCQTYDEKGTFHFTDNTHFQLRDRSTNLKVYSIVGEYLDSTEACF